MRFPSPPLSLSTIRFSPLPFFPSVGPSHRFSLCSAGRNEKGLFCPPPLHGRRSPPLPPPLLHCPDFHPPPPLPPPLPSSICQTFPSPAFPNYLLRASSASSFPSSIASSCTVARRTLRSRRPTTEVLAKDGAGEDWKREKKKKKKRRGRTEKRLLMPRPPSSSSFHPGKRRLP